MNAEPGRPEADEAETTATGEQDETTEDTAADSEAEPSAQAQDDAADPVAELQARVDENWDKFLRASAELENVRKRAARDVENAHKFALERFATDLLDVCDSLEMALNTDQDVSIESLREGNDATLKLLGSILQRFGVEELNPQGEPFDPVFHEAMTMQPSDVVEPGSVVTVFQKGYALNGRLLRPARVVVAAAPSDLASKS